MDVLKKQKAIKKLIILLIILLAFSVAVLAGTLAYKHFATVEPSSVVIPDNIITPDTEDEQADTSIGDTTEPSQNESTSATGNSSTSEEETSADTQTESRPASSNPSVTDIQEETTAIYLHNRNPGDNIPFNVVNMLPGDVETKYFCLRVSYYDDITVKYYANIRPGYEKLAEVLKCRIVLLTTGETMYDGLMRDMPESLNHKLCTSSETTTDLYYEITAYLDTSVGNEYQNKELISDFRWWVEEEAHLANNPQTGDDSNLTLWSGLVIGSLFMLILLFVARKKEERNEQYR